MFTHDLGLRGTITEIVKVYETETQHMREAYTLLETASKNLTQVLKTSEYGSIDTMPRGCYNYQSTCSEVLASIKQGTWKRLIAMLGIKRLLSEKRNEELDKKLENAAELPEITVENVFEMFDLLLQNANDFARESIVEVYRKLHNYPADHYVTNKRNAREDLGKKVILPGIVDNQSHYGQTDYVPFKVDYRDHDFLTAIDRVFHNLDGAPFLQEGYRCPLIDAINTSKTGTGETEYFKFWCYQNRNLHLEFKRADLLKLFNQIANDGTRLKSGVKF